MVLIPADPTLIGLRLERDLPQGEVRVSWAGGHLVVDHADPRVIISLRLLDHFVCGRAAPEVTVRHPDGVTPSWAGAVIRIEAVNRTLLYRLTEYLDWYGGWVAEWPDLASRLGEVLAVVMLGEHLLGVAGPWLVRQRPLALGALDDGEPSCGDLAGRGGRRRVDESGPGFGHALDDG